MTILVLWSQTFSLQNYKKYISVAYKAPRLWYFVIAAKTEQDSLMAQWVRNLPAIQEMQVQYLDEDDTL